MLVVVCHFSVFLYGLLFLWYAVVVICCSHVYIVLGITLFYHGEK